MPTEIERKFLVRGDGWKAKADGGSRLRQAYLASTDGCAVRVRIKDEAKAFLTIKSARPGASRDEFEYEVSVEDARAMLELRTGEVIEKTRYRVPAGDLCWEIDVFAGAHAGLTIAEIELPDEGAHFERPDWLGDEVTQDKRYYNASLALRALPKA
jgi:CYTH domain-containing protein